MVVLPAPFGPRKAKTSPTAYLQVDAAHRMVRPIAHLQARNIYHYVAIGSRLGVLDQLRSNASCLPTLLMTRNDHEVVRGETIPTGRRRVMVWVGTPR